MDKSLWKTEIIGVGFVAACSSAMLRLYDFCGGQALGILFGAVNNSAWERCKTLLLPYLVWGLLELLCVRVAVYRFTVAKTAGLYFLGALCLPLGDLLPAAPCAALSVCAFCPGGLLSVSVCGGLCLLHAVSAAKPLVPRRRDRALRHTADQRRVSVTAMRRKAQDIAL